MTIKIFSMIFEIMFDSLSVYDKADCCPFIETLDESTFKLFWPD